MSLCGGCYFGILLLCHAEKGEAAEYDGGPHCQAEGGVGGTSVVLVSESQDGSLRPAPLSSSWWLDCLSETLQSLLVSQAPPQGHLCWCLWRPEWERCRAKWPPGALRRSLPPCCPHPPLALRQVLGAENQGVWRGRTLSPLGWSWPCFCQDKRRVGLMQMLTVWSYGEIRAAWVKVTHSREVFNFRESIKLPLPHLLKSFNLLTAFWRLSLKHVTVVGFGRGGKLGQWWAASTVWKQSNKVRYKPKGS